MTVSFSFDGERDGLGRRKSAFNNARAAPRVTNARWTRGEAQVVRCVLSKDVILATYRDAVFRGILSKAAAAEEVRGILSHYDQSIVRLMKRDPSDNPGPDASESPDDDQSFHDDTASFTRTGDLCEECGEPQFEVPGSGVSCSNGHGGAGSVSPTPPEDDGLAAMFGDLS